MLIIFFDSFSLLFSVSASVDLPLHHKVQKFSSGTGSPGWSRKKGRKMVVLWYFLENVNSRSRSLYAIAHPSVVCHPSVICLSSVTLVHPIQAVVIFGNISTAFGTLAIR